MNKILGAAMQCDSRLKLKALKTICITLIVIVVLVSLVAVKVLNTIDSYNEVNVKVSSSSVNVESNLNR